MASTDSCSSAQQLSDERRESQLRHLYLRADVTLPGDLTVANHTVDLSAAGALIEVPYKLDVGARCSIELITVPIPALRDIPLAAEVRHCGLRGARFYAGLQFSRLTPPLQAALEGLFRSGLS